MNTSEIIAAANSCRQYFKTQDPFQIAEAMGIRIIIRDSAPKYFKAHVIKLENYPIFICINGKYNEIGRKMLCAHELGHAIFHDTAINTFGLKQDTMYTRVEYEANLFAVSLLFNEADFNLPFSEMSNTLLKHILDSNIH